MRLDLRLHGHIDDGRKCTADLSVYIKDDAEKEKAVMEASNDAPWLLCEPGWPDVPDGSNITVDSVENLNERRVQSHAKMLAPGIYAGSGPPGSLKAFLEQMGLPMFPEDGPGS